MNASQHARQRAQQRGISPLIDHWLDQYGEEQYDGHGGVVIYFDHRSKGAIQRYEVQAKVRRMWKLLNAYKVESSHDGTIITVGHRFRHIKRP